MMEIDSNSNHIRLFHDKGSSFFSTAYQESLTNESFATDVIIKTGPEKIEFVCHRLVLASSSPFLSEILASATPGTIPVILLPDLSALAMELVLIYMYYGEVHVPTKLYSEFVDVCNLLDLKHSTNDFQIVSVGENSVKQEQEISMPEEQEEVMVQNMPQDESFDMKMNHDLGYSQSDNEQPSNKSYFSLSRISVTPEMISTVQQRLVIAVQRAYNTLQIEMTDQIQKSILESKAIIEDDILVRGIHICALCGSNIRREQKIRYKVFSRSTKSVTYIIENLKKHLKEKHPEVCGKK